MSANPTISKNWIKKKYWEEEKTAEEMAAMRKVKTSYVQALISKYNLTKKKNGIKRKGKKGYKMPESEKDKHKAQPHAKPINVFKVESKAFVGTYRSIAHAANELGLLRTHIKDCLNPCKPRWSSKGYTFEHRKYKGEIIIERRMNLDFTVEFEKVCVGLTSKLPDYPYQERIQHYNNKLAKVWEELIKKGKL
ncbi:hypothetical protein [Arcobacter roscoffensis]|uniref:Uncharacterized protein n=1 Tax=Arcobacter roscoffensis TaxID=2961520 RepID=A0ABY5E2T5_9BACT|nr:hypothetical protein [Arcobacter roscoffensis]UTJ05413.1 hypothetical protein NJU99_09045 [Arcobacter roscoffensis]